MFCLTVKDAGMADSNSFDGSVEVFFFVKCLFFFYNILNILQYLALVAKSY